MVEVQAAVVMVEVVEVLREEEFSAQAGRLGFATTGGRGFAPGAPALYGRPAEVPAFGGEPTSTTVLTLVADDDDSEFCPLFD